MDNTHLIDSIRRRRSKSGKIKKWSDAMSPEAKVAMQLALEDTKAMKLEQEFQIQQTNQQCKSPTRVVFADDKEQNGDNSTHIDKVVKEHPGLSREASYTELFERNGSARMRRDITDDSYSEDSDKKRALGGGKVESAMEMIEIVDHDNPDEGALMDEHAIEELARINSVDKCTVWIEATQVHNREPLPNIPEHAEAEFGNKEPTT